MTYPALLLALIGVVLGMVCTLVADVYAERYITDRDELLRFERWLFIGYGFQIVGLAGAAVLIIAKHG